MLFKRKRTKNTSKQDMIVKSYAYDALIEYGADSLPVSIPDYDPSKILIISWQKYFRHNAKPIYCDITKYDGLLMCLDADTNKRYIIFYDENMSYTLKNLVISKLLYYIRCGIADKNPGTYFACDSLSKAEEFASHYTCPDVILETCEITSAENIMYYCQVPFSLASRKARYFKNGYDRFIFPALERTLKDQFKLFIEKFAGK